MSQVLDQTSKKIVDQVPENKKWKKSSMRKWGGLAILISALAVLAGVPFSVVFWVDVALLVIAEIYGRVTGKMEVPLSGSSYKSTKIYEGPFSSDSLNYERKYGSIFDK
jgi:hypothetical protein